MSDKKQKAKLDVLKALSAPSRGSSDLMDKLKGKKMEKVTVMAKDKKGLAEGLSMAKKILQAKHGVDAKGKAEEEMEEECPDCEGKGCKECMPLDEEESEE